MSDTTIEWTDKTIRRFWSYVHVGDMNECWLWMAGLFSNGYGQFRLGPKKIKAHRAAFQLTQGRLPDDDHIILHFCDNPPCCNPAQLQSQPVACGSNL